MRRWLLWAAATLGGFLALEIPAYRTGRRPTLTQVIRRGLGVAPKRRWRFLPCAAFSALLTLFASHILRDWP